MKIFLSILLCLNSVFCFCQNDINKIEIYAKPFLLGYKIPTPKSEIKKRSTAYVTIFERNQIRASKIQKYINELTPAIKERQKDWGNYDALLIIHYTNRKKEKYYILAGYYGVYKDGVLYNYSCEFMSSLCRFLPFSYYDDTGSEKYFSNFCNEESMFVDD